MKFIKKDLLVGKNEENHGLSFTRFKNLWVQPSKNSQPRDCSYLVAGTDVAFFRFYKFQGISIKTEVAS